MQIMDLELKKKIVRQIITERLRRYYAEVRASCSNSQDFLARFAALPRKVRKAITERRRPII